MIEAHRAIKILTDRVYDPGPASNSCACMGRIIAMREISSDHRGNETRLRLLGASFYGECVSGNMDFASGGFLSASGNISVFFRPGIFSSFP